MDYSTTRLLRQGVPLAMTLAILLLALVACSTLYLGREVFVPVALAVLLSFLLAPAVRLLQRARFPHGLAIITVVLLAFAAIALLGTIVASQLSDLASDLPRYRETVRVKAEGLGGLASGGLGRAFRTIQDLSGELKALGSSTADGHGPDGRPMAVVVQGGGSVVETVGGFVSPLLHPLATGGLVLIIAIFVLAQREDLRNRFIRLVGTDDLQHTTAVIDDAARRLSRLFLTQLAVNTGFGTLIGVGLWIIGVPSPVLWGVLAGILRFVPYVGAVVAAALPLILAIAVDPGWSMVLWTLALFAIVEPLVGHVLEPLLYGRSTGISPVAVILAATVWTFLWGPIGLVLATPLTVCLVVLGRHVGQLEFFDIMLGDRPVLSPAEIFYQRMLAGDPSEAILQAREFLRERALSTYYDEVALEGIRLAHEDIARGRISPARQEVLRQSIKVLLKALDSVRDPTPKRGGPIGAEAAAAVDAAGPDRAAATRVLATEDLRAEWRGTCPVVCVAAPDTLDEIVAEMLAQVLTKHGLTARVFGTRTASVDAGEIAHMGIRVACLSYVEPLSTLHLRHAVQQSRRRTGGAQVMLGLWRQRDPGMVLSLRHAARATGLATTVGGMLTAVTDKAAEPRLDTASSPERRQVVAVNSRRAAAA